MFKEIKTSRHQPALLTSIYQWLTYESLHQGLPTKSFNQKLIGKSQSVAKSLYPGQSIHMIQSELEPIASEGSFSKIHLFPRYTCIARLYHPDPIHEMTKSSCLVIVWMQESFAFPIDEDILMNIQQVNWDSIALDCEC